MERFLRLEQVQKGKEPRDIERSEKKKQLLEEDKEVNIVFFTYVNE